MHFNERQAWPFGLWNTKDTPDSVRLGKASGHEGPRPVQEKTLAKATEGR